MASEQARRENVTDERKLQLEKDRVHKMASHFESLADKVHEDTETSPDVVHVKTTVTSSVPYQEHQTEKQRSSDIIDKTQERKQQVFQEKPDGVKFGVQGQEHEDSDINRGKQSKGGAEETKGAPSLEEISQYRATAQQKSMNAIRAAEERYEKAKEMGGSALQNVKESATHGLGATGTYAAEKGAQAKYTITQGLKMGTQYVAEKAGAAKDVALEKGQQAYAATKDTLSGAGQTAAQSAQQAKDYTMEKTGEAKDYVAQKTGDTKDYTSQNTWEAKDYVAKKTGEIQEQSKGAARKGAVGFAGKVAETVKDKAVVAGWGAAHFTAEKAADATKAVAGVTSTVAGYAGGTTVAAKDLVVDAGKKTVGYAEDTLAAAKDYVVSVEESAAEYAARKKAEAERELEAKKLQEDTKGENRGGEKVDEKERRKEKIEESYFEEEEEESRVGKESMPVEGAAVVLEAIGETIVELGKQLLNLLQVAVEMNQLWELRKSLLYYHNEENLR
ncbi:hypothetical protein H5410_038444 [Solanum commersonii]|uniref:Seed biotin-containing protein SBP65 n=1 Tax=Solanum commersonii TaxID=4109 RepID=A0A9J5YD56_SOLCO|nr:hypothetical protein H5410_038444 [Solanum commersonii]